MFKKKIKLQIVCYLIVALFANLGCNKKQSETASIILDFSKDPVSIHDIGLIHDVEIFHLDYNKALFGEINKIIRHKDRIYLMDMRQTKSVFVYDTLGQFINKISKYGQGPNEYLQLTDIFIDNDDASLNIVSRSDRKILKYDLNGEQLISVLNTPKSFEKFLKMKEGYVGYMGNWSQDKNKPFNVWTMSKILNIDKWLFEIDPTWESKGFGDGTVFSTYKSSTYYITPMDFNIYRIENENASIAYSFDLGSLACPVKEYDFYAELRNNPVPPYILRFYNFQETSNHLIVQVLYKGQALLGVYNKQSDSSHIVKLDTYKGKYIFFFGHIVSFDEKTIYALVSAPNIKMMWDGKNQYIDFESKYPEQVNNLRKKFTHVDEEDNPYLVMYHID